MGENLETAVVALAAAGPAAGRMLSALAGVATTDVATSMAPINAQAANFGVLKRFLTVESFPRKARS
jgi:hypothetical protein